MKFIRSVVLVFFLMSSLVFVASVHAFNQPWAINMGITSFLDGGPDQPRHGLFFNQYLVLVQSDGFLDKNGDKVEAIPPLSIPSIGVDMNNWISISQFIYLSKKRFLGANLGAELGLSYVDLNFKYDSPEAANNMPSDQSAISDTIIGPFLQWDPIKFDNEMIFVHRFELQVLLPTGRYDNRYMANGSANHYSFNPYWAASLHITRQWCVSTRVHYLWNFENDDPYHALGAKEIRPGQVFHFNFASTYEVLPRLLRLGINGYYLRQTSDTKFVNQGTTDFRQDLMQEFLGSRQKVLGVGPGALIMLSRRNGIFINTYFESNVESRPKCQRYQIRWAHQF